MDEVFGGTDRQVVHHLQAAGDDTGRDDVTHGAAGLFHRVEGRQQHLGHLRLGQQLDRHLGDDAKHALGAGEQRQQVETRCIQGIAAEGHELAFDGEDVDLEQVMHGQAVLQAVHATGIFGDVAADGAGDLRGRVGGVIQVEGRGGLGDRQVAHAGLHAGEAAFAVDLENLVEARHHQQDALLQRQCAAGQTGTGAARHHRYATGMAELEQLLHLLDALWQYHQHGCGAIGGEAIALVRLEVFLGMQDVKVGQALAQLGQQGGLVDLG